MPSLLKPGGTDTTPGVAQTSATINAPEIEDLRSLRATVRSISSIDQIYSICESGFNPDSDRNVKNGIIALQINDAPPFGSQGVKGQNYRHNASTGFLSAMLDPAIASPVGVIDQAQYLTSASLDEKDDPDGSKSTAYRRKFTETVRDWDGWRSHIYNIASEDVDYGYAAVVCDDPDDWRPEDCRQDNFGVPDNTGQTPDKCQFFFRKKSFYLDELINVILKQPADADGPWDIEACVEALNDAMPQDRQGESMTQSNRSFADLVRDGNSGAAYDPKARTVDAYILLAKEADGKVSKFIVTQKTSTNVGEKKRLLYESYDEFEKLSDCLMFYTLKNGTGTLYSSKGGGRDLINMSMIQERGRNKACDHTYLAALVWMHSEKGMVAVQLKVGDTSAIIGSEAQVKPDALPDRSEIFDRQDERITRWCQQKFGPYMPNKPSEADPSKERTAHEVERDWQQDQINRAAWLTRFFGQFGDEMGLIAKKLGNPESTDEVAQAFQKDLEENDGITPDLLKKLVDQPQGQVIDDLTQKRTQLLVQARPGIAASPYWDQYLVEREIAVRTFGPEMVNRLMFKNGIDPTREARNIHDQEIENQAIRVGGSPNAVPDDHHETHLKWGVGHLDQDESQIIKKVADGSILQEPSIIDNWQTAIKHFDGHVGMWENQAKARNNQEELKRVNQFKGRLKQSQDKIDASLKAMVALKKAQAEQQQQAQDQDGGMGQMMQPQGQGQPQQQGRGMDKDILKQWVGHYKDLPDDLKRQVEIASGFTPHQGEIPASNGAKENALTSGGGRLTT